MQLNTEFVTRHYAVLRTSKHKNIRHVKSCSSKHKVSGMLNYTSLLSWSMIRQHDQNLLLYNYCSYPQFFYFFIISNLTTHVIAFLCPTKSILIFQPSRSRIFATGPALFIACADTT